ncbi:MAG: hypothetical protein IT302_08545 [Dehalococcoidia bacterium]|nr:hypothetical protein [Dehalococcoidia bacterium]
MNEQDILPRAALAVVRAADYEASFYEAQSPVEDWALDALQAAVRGDPARASALLDRYEHADWELRRAYAFSEWDNECPAAVRAANVP